MGATTMWQRWDSLPPDGRVNPGEMTSVNHYVLGAVAEWMHSNIGGLSLLIPGRKKFRIAPGPGGDLTHATARYLRPYGWIEAKWSIVADEFIMTAIMPPNTTADVLLPVSSRNLSLLVQEPMNLRLITNIRYGRRYLSILNIIFMMMMSYDMMYQYPGEILGPCIAVRCVRVHGG
ncbi:hypothetical protein VTL71DRAFT_9421 [Oculimacula yallundae]|uniref:alpha-L-rhamnosidase n=1 Tax=Oculimacula yallundae TaxID=86028 RepID=A0ABR4BSZ7_9HELO